MRRGGEGVALDAPYSVFFRSVKFSFCAKKWIFVSLIFARTHHTPTHARWSCGKIFGKRTNFRTDEKTRYTVLNHLCPYKRAVLLSRLLGYKLIIQDIMIVFVSVFAVWASTAICEDGAY